MKGYHQWESSKSLTTFITPFGHFRYLCVPYGLSSIAEHYNRRMAEVFKGLTGFRRIVDDIVMYERDIASHMTHVQQFLRRCQDKKISLEFPTPVSCTDLCSFFWTSQSSCKLLQDCRIVGTSETPLQYKE